MERNSVEEANLLDDSTDRARPFLKFAGGKRAIIAELLARVPSRYEAYHEPFVGGGALFFSLDPERAYISDINKELMNCYTVIREDLQNLMSALWMIPYDRGGNDESNRAVFNAIRGLDRDENFGILPPVFRAARTIFLNRTCYNGLWRVNSRGEFNTPFGKYKNPKIVDELNLQLCSSVLQSCTISNDDFTQSLKRVKKDDFVYLDPPYLPSSSTADFTSYHEDGFGYRDHQRLAEECHRLDKLGAKFLLSNSNTPEAKDLYKGFHIDIIEAPRSINREKSTDILVRNH